MKKYLKNNKFLYIFIILCILPISLILFIGISIDTPVVISENVIQSIYSNNNYEYNSYYNFINNKDNIDNNITKKSLKSVKYLTVDTSNYGNSDFFKYTDNLESLIINNYQNIQKYDINNLKNLKSLKTLYITLDGNYVLKNPNYKIDLSIFSNLETVYITCNLPKEIDSFISYNIIEKYKNYKNINIVFSDNIDLSKLENWNSKINSIIDSLNIDYSNEKDIATKVANFVTSYLQYDNDIFRYLNNYTEKDFSNKITYYNQKLLSSIFDNNDKIKNAICCNYAAFTNIIFYKLGIESYYITGSINNSAHSWNYINIDDNYYFMDLTFLDSKYEKFEILISINNKKYDNYTIPIEKNIDFNTVYYNRNAPKIIVKWNEIF